MELLESNWTYQFVAKTVEEMTVQVRIAQTS